MAFALGGCGVTLRTQPPRAPESACFLTEIRGELKADVVWGLGLLNRGSFTGVVWPHGYAAKRDGAGVVVLLDRDGQILAREGETVVLAGVHGDDGVTYPCDPPDLRVITP